MPLRTTTKSTAKRPSTPSRGELGADLGRLRGDRARVGEVGREAAAEVALATRSAQELVVGREQLDLAQRRHAQLHARAADLDARPPAPRRCRRPRAGGRGSARGASRGARRPSTRRARAAPRAPRPIPAPEARAARRRVAAARDAVVELDDRVRRAGPRRAQARQRIDDVVEVAHVLEALRVRHAGLARTTGGSRSSCPAGAAGDPRRRAVRRAPARGRARASSWRTGSGGSGCGRG